MAKKITMPVDREEHEGGEEARNVEPILRFEQAEGEARAGPGRAGGELGDHGGDQGEAAGDPQAREKIGQRVRQLEKDERPPAAGAVELEQVEEVVVGAAQALRRVGQDREEGDDPGADQDRALRGRRIDQDQRRDRDDRRHLQDDGVGVEGELDPARLRHDDGERDAADERDGERREGDLQRDEERGDEDRPIRRHRLGDADRARQDVVRHVVDRHIDLPDDEQEREHRDRHQDAEHALDRACRRCGGGRVVVLTLRRAAFGLRASLI